MLGSARFARWLPALAWMAFISYWSSQSVLPIDEPLVGGLDKSWQHRLAHVGAFGVLAVLDRWALGPLPRAGWWAWLLAAGFGAVDEWHQGFTPGRQPGLADWLTDAAAAAVAAPLADWWLARREQGRASRLPERSDRGVERLAEC